jgi:flagellin-specific chaperone FliS
MNPYRAYQGQPYANWLRIDLLLALYDGAIEKLEAAVAAVRKPDRAAAMPLLARVRIIVAGLVVTVDRSRGDVAGQFLRLYEFVNHCLGTTDVKKLEAAANVLRTLREGSQSIRAEAVELERSEQVPPLDAVPIIQITA